MSLLLVHPPPFLLDTLLFPNCSSSTFFSVLALLQSRVYIRDKACSICLSEPSLYYLNSDLWFHIPS